MSNCEWLNRYRDGELNDSQQKEFVRHLSACEKCRMWMAVLDNTVSVLRQEAAQTVDLSERIARRAFTQVANITSWDGLLASWFRPRFTFATLGMTIALYAFLWFAHGSQTSGVTEYERFLNQAEDADLAGVLLTSSDSEYALTLLQGWDAQ